MSNIAVRKNTGQYQPRDKGIYANDLNYLLSKAGNQSNYRMNDAVGFNDGKVQDKTWLMEYSDSESILLNLGFIWRNGRLCKQTDNYSGGLSQQLGDELNFVRVLESNIPTAKPDNESTMGTAGLTGSSSIWYVLMLSSDDSTSSVNTYTEYTALTQLSNPATTPNKYHVLRFTREEIQDIYTGLPTHFDSCRKIIGCANFTEDGKLLSINNSFLKGDIKEEYEQKPFDLYRYDPRSTEASLYIFNCNIKDNITGKRIYPADFIGAVDTPWGTTELTKVDLTYESVNYIYVEYNPLGTYESVVAEFESGTAEIKCIPELELEAYLLENPEYEKRLLWTIEIAGDFNDVVSFKRHLDEDIYIGDVTGLKPMPFDVSKGFATTTTGPLPEDIAYVDSITIRNGGFYLKENGQYRFVGQGIGGESINSVAPTVFGLENYEFEQFSYLNPPSEPVSVGDPTKFIVWAGIDVASVTEEVFIEITPADEKPVRDASILTPIAELNWVDVGTESVSDWTFSLNQLKRGFIYEESNIDMPYDTTYVSYTETGDYFCNVRCGGFAYTDRNGVETWRGIDSAGNTITFPDYDFNSFFTLTARVEKSVICAFLFYHNDYPDTMLTFIIPVDTDLDDEGYFSGHTIVAKQPIAQLIIPDPTSEDPEPEPYIIQLKRGFISYNLDTGAMPFDCNLIGDDVTPGAYTVQVRNGLFIFDDEEGVRTTSATDRGIGALLSEYDFSVSTYIDLSSSKPIAAAVLYREISTGDFGSAVGYFNRSLAIDGWIDELYYEVLEIIPIAELIIPDPTSEDPEPEAYLNQLAHGFQYVDPFGDDDLQNLVFRVVKVGATDKLQCYIASSNKYYDVVYYNGIDINENDTALLSGITPNWLDVRTTAFSLPSAGATKYIYFYIRRINSGTIMDYSNPGDLIWTLDDSNSGYSDWWNNSMILASVTNNAGVYSVKHFRKGSIHIESRLGDATNFYAVGANTRTKQRSIDVIGGYGSNYSHELYNFSYQTAPTTDITSLNFVTTESFTGGTKQICYLTASTLFAYIDTLIPPPITCDDLTDCFDGWLDYHFWDWFCGEIGGPWLGEGDPPWQCLIDFIGGTAAHSLLADLVAGTDTDDHVDSTRKAGATATVSYLNLDGDAGRNAFSESAYIGAQDGTISIDPNGRTLADSSEWYSVDWGNRLLVAPNNVIIAEWSDGGFNVTSGTYGYNYVSGVTITNWTGGGIVTGTSIVEISAIDLLDTDKILVIRGV